MANIRFRTGALSKDLRNLGDVLNALGEVAERERLSSRRLRAILTATKALYFACDQTRILDFNRFLLNWPGELTGAEERHLAELGVEDKRAPSRRTIRRRRKGG